MPKQISDGVVFEAVNRVLFRCGYARAKMSEIAAEAGVSEMSLFRKYSSKAHLVVEAIVTLHRDGPLSQIAYTGDLETDIRTIIKAHFATDRALGPTLAVLLIEAPGTPELRPALEAPLDLMRNIAEVLARHQHEGRLRPMPPEAVVNALMAPLIIQSMMSRALGGAQAAEQEIDDIVAAFLDGHRL